MNVNLNSISLQQRKFSGTNSIGGIHLPDFNDKYVFSKKKSNTSNVEYKKQIAEQAYEDFKNGQFQNKSEGFNKLMKKYTSEVSPDRKGIITSGLKAVSRNKQSGLKPIDLLATILEGMLMCGKVTNDNLIDSSHYFRDTDQYEKLMWGFSYISFCLSKHFGESDVFVSFLLTASL